MKDWIANYEPDDSIIWQSIPDASSLLYVTELEKSLEVRMDPVQMRSTSRKLIPVDESLSISPLPHKRDFNVSRAEAVMSVPATPTSRRSAKSKESFVLKLHEFAKKILF